MTHGTQKPFNSNIFRNFASANYQNQKNMDLKTFVKETLTQIAEGVNEAKPIVKECGCYVVDRKPSSMDETIPNCICDDGYYHPVTKLNFDVALETTTDKGTKSGLSVSVASVLGGGVKREDGTSESSISRVAFSLYVAMQ